MRLQSIEKSWLETWLGQESLIFSTAYSPALRSTQFPIQ